MKRYGHLFAVVTWFCLSFQSVPDLVNAINIPAFGPIPTLMASAHTAKIVNDGPNFDLVFNFGKHTSQDVTDFLQHYSVNAQVCS